MSATAIHQTEPDTLEITDLWATSVAVAAKVNQLLDRRAGCRIDEGELASTIYDRLLNDGVINGRAA